MGTVPSASPLDLSSRTGIEGEPTGVPPAPLFTPVWEAAVLPLNRRNESRTEGLRCARHDPPSPRRRAGLDWLGLVCAYAAYALASQFLRRGFSCFWITCGSLVIPAWFFPLLHTLLGLAPCGLDGTQAPTAVL